MATITVSRPDAMKDWGERRAEAGFGGDASRYIRDLIRKDQERTAAIAVLQTAITDGLESGEAQPFDATAFKHRMREKHAVR
ncbi:type II toxin-antitoxin system ParD family antitoxin [Zavarzinia sp.]|uniref:ribbon-helix-helix domain-containing protein n=1 Tax=Zavarzinia sp. TaxID=2027920 RepID=UPI003562FB7B